MKRELPRSLTLQYLVFTTVLIIAILLLDTYYEHIVYQGIWWVLAFFIVLSMVSVAIMDRAAARSPRNFMNIYLAAMVARLFISIIVAALFILYDKEHVMVFAGNFIALYLLYLGFEIYGILSSLRHHFREGPEQSEGGPDANT